MTEFERVKKENRLTTYEDYIFVKPINESDFVTFPLESLEGCLAITLEQYLGLKEKRNKFNETLTKVVENEK